jgi:hypothetical protein
MKQDKEIRVIKIWKEEVKLPLFSLYIKDLRTPPKNS